jgi:glycerol-3-phosphate acyltransferase PlsY
MLAPVYALYFLGLGTSAMVVFMMSLLLAWKHKSNIASLLAGKEARIGERSLP